MNFGTTILGDNVDRNNIFFIRVTIDEGTGEIIWPKPYVEFKEAV